MSDRRDSLVPGNSYIIRLGKGFLPELKGRDWKIKILERRGAPSYDFKVLVKGFREEEEYHYANFNIFSRWEILRRTIWREDE